MNIKEYLIKEIEKLNSQSENLDKKCHELQAQYQANFGAKQFLDQQIREKKEYQLTIKE